MGNGLVQMLRDEVVAIYGGANLIVGALPDLGVRLTPQREHAILIVGNVVLAPIVRHFTNEVPSTNTKLKAQVAALDGEPPFS